MKFSIIGCEHAHIQIFIRDMLALGRACAGLYEPRNEKLAQEIADRCRIPIVHDPEQLLTPDVEVVGCAAINNEKIDWIECCEKRGKSIVIDKPAVVNRRDYERLEGVMHRGTIAVGMLLTERFHPAVYTLKQLIDRGVLGRLVTIGMRKPHLLNAASRPEWFYSKERSGGILIDLLIHDFDLLRWLTGSEIARTDGYMTKQVLPECPDFYDSVSLQVLMEHGTAAQLYADWHTPDRSWTWGDGRIFATGTEGFAELRLTGDPFVKQEALLLLTTDSEGPRQIPLERCPVTITEDFLNRINGKPSLLTGDDLLRATKATIQADEQVRRI